jgi:hypothetical protein
MSGGSHVLPTVASYSCKSNQQVLATQGTRSTIQFSNHHGELLCAGLWARDEAGKTLPRAVPALTGVTVSEFDHF